MNKSLSIKISVFMLSLALLIASVSFAYSKVIKYEKVEIEGRSGVTIKTNVFTGEVLVRDPDTFKWIELEDYLLWN